MATRFPLRRLPDIARNNVIKQMNPLEMVELSLCSKSMKNTVKSVGIRFDEILYLQLDRDISIGFGPRRHCSIRLDYENSPTFSEYPLAVKYLQLRIGEVKTKENSKFLVADWVDHVKYIFSYSKAMLCVRRLSEALGVQNICELIKDVEVTTLFITGGGFQTEFLSDVLNSIQPSKKLHLDKNPFSDPWEFRKILSKKYEHLDISSTVKMNLVDILVTNSTVVTIWTPELIAEEMNVIISMWMKGWNSKLKVLQIHFKRWHLDNTFLEKTLDGIENTVNKEKRVYENNSMRVEFKFGYNMERSDGTKATLAFHDDHVILKCYFLVWN